MFQDGYLEHAGAFYVSDVDEDGARKEVTTELVSSWDLNWLDENVEFERILRADEELKALSGKLFLCVQWQPSSNGLEEGHRDSAPRGRRLVS